jgi:hypothetical protein
MKKNMFVQLWYPPRHLRAEFYFWSFHLINPGPTTAYAEVIFYYPVALSGPRPPWGTASINAQLDIGNVVGISAGSFLDPQLEIYPFDVIGADLDLVNSAKIGTTSVTVVNGVATLNNMGLYLNCPTGGSVELMGGPQNGAGQIAWTAGSVIDGGGTWSLKSSWSTFGMMGFGPNLANPPLTQPAAGEFSL